MDYYLGLIGRASIYIQVVVVEDCLTSSRDFVAWQSLDYDWQEANGKPNTSTSSLGHALAVGASLSLHWPFAARGAWKETQKPIQRNALYGTGIRSHEIIQLLICREIYERLQLN